MNSGGGGSNSRPNRQGIVLPISSHLTILLGSLSIILLFGFMAQLFMARNMLEISKEALSLDLKMGVGPGSH